MSYEDDLEAVRRSLGPDTWLRDKDGGASGLARDVSTPANPKEEALRASLERLIQQWRTEQHEAHYEAVYQERKDDRRYARALRHASVLAKCADELQSVLSSLTREREP